MAAKASDIKALRESTGAGMMDCKKALEESNGDMAAAEKYLKEKGLAAMAKRSDRATAEGRVAIKREGSKIAMVELVCETDFVAKNDDFAAVAQKLCDATLARGDGVVGSEHESLVTDLATKFRENMSCRRAALVTVPENSCAGTYVHSDGKTGAVVVVKGSSGEKAAEFANDCCLHLAAFTPQFISQKEVPQSYIDEQTEIFKSQIEQDEKMASKPQAVKDGVLKGKLSKHLAEVCFVDQMFVKDDKMSVAKKLAEVGKEAGAQLEFGDIKLFVLGK